MKVEVELLELPKGAQLIKHHMKSELIASMIHVACWVEAIHCRMYMNWGLTGVGVL